MQKMRKTSIKIVALLLAGIMILEYPAQAYAEQVEPVQAEEMSDVIELGGQITETPQEVISSETEEEKDEAAVSEEEPSSEDEVTEPTLQKVKLEAVSLGFDRIRLSWEMDEEATAYHIYRRQGEEEYELLAEVSASEETDYVDTGLEFNETYEYTICSIAVIDGKEYVGETSDPVAQKMQLEAVVMDSVVCVDYQTLQITWNPVYGAGGYEIYRRAGDAEDWAMLDWITSGCSYKDAGVVPGTEYSYKVRAFRLLDEERIYSEDSEVCSGRTELKQVTNLKAAATSYNVIQLTWDKTGGQKYQIWYRTSEEQDWQYLTSTVANTYQYTGVICGQDYWFRVRGVLESQEELLCGEYSSVAKQRTIIGNTTASVKEVRCNRITIGWTAVAGAQKYEIYYSPHGADGEFVYVGSTTDLKYTHKNRTLGHTYYYKVRAVRQLSNGNFSKVVSGKTRLDALTGLSASRSGTSISLKWNLVEGVDHYDIYRSTGGSYTKVGTVKTNTYKQDGCSRATTYKYKVVGVQGSYTTEATVQVKAVETPWKTSYGIDVSAYQGTVDWGAVADDGVSFAMLRIITGSSSNSTTLDTQFENNYRRARRNGIKVGVYRYSYATTASGARREAQKIIEALDGRALDYPIAMDMEAQSVLNATSKSDRTRIVRAFKEEIESAGYKFVLYANLNWLNNYLDMNALSDCEVWIARYRDFGRGHGYTGRGTVTMWQYTSTGRVSGISGNVDKDVSYKGY